MRGCDVFDVNWMTLVLLVLVTLPTLGLCLLNAVSPPLSARTGQSSAPHRLISKRSCKGNVQEQNSTFMVAQYST